MAGLLLFIIPMKRRRWAMRLAMLAFLVSLTGGLAGCGGGSSASTPQGNSGTTPGSYIVTVTATSGAASATLPVTVIVQ